MTTGVSTARRFGTGVATAAAWPLAFRYMTVNVTNRYDRANGSNRTDTKVDAISTTVQQKLSTYRLRKFRPIMPVATRKAPAVSAMVSGGKYQMPAESGPTPGVHRVAVYYQGGFAPHPTIEHVIAFDENHGLVFDVKPGKNSFDVALNAR